MPPTCPSIAQSHYYLRDRQDLCSLAQGPVIVAVVEAAVAAFVVVVLVLRIILAEADGTDSSWLYSKRDYSPSPLFPMECSTAVFEYLRDNWRTC